jgi:hypothetical protein
MVMERPGWIYFYLAEPHGYADCYRYLLFNGKQHRFRLQPVNGLYYLSYR